MRKNEKGDCMRRSEDYWVIFSKTGKIEDYLRYKAVEDMEKTQRENETEHKRTDS